MQPASLYRYYQECPRISTDTRAIKPDSLFFALKGTHFNGNAFAAEALEKGARYAVIDEPRYRQDDRFLLVADVLAALQKLARYHRERLRIPIIGITGSNGKTTTKELLHAVLSRTFNTYATQGNLNNHIGVPLTLLSLDRQTQLAIVEMGANHPGEIAFLCNIAQPTHGLITNVGKAHLEGFGGFEGVMRTKGELYDYLAGHGGTVFLQQDNPNLREMAESRAINQPVTYGFSEGNDVVGILQSADPVLEIQWHAHGSHTHHTVTTRLTGAYNTENLLAAVCVGRHFGVSATDINKGLTDYTPSNNRSQLTKTAANTVIRDYYNANASSMAAALENLKLLKADRKVIILGDMFELGEASPEEHRKLVDLACAMGVDRVLFVGHEFARHKRPGAEFHDTTDAAKAALQLRPITGALVLLKASRSMAFEKLMDSL